jgi:hypothetical protein
MAKKNMRRLSPQLPIREKQNHDDMSLPTIMANILPMLPTKRKSGNTNNDKNMEKLITHIAGVNVKWLTAFKKLNVSLLYD